uniref:Transmembrane protein n=1 Tax=Chlamydomonas leiostraca TaxID=1034604 RepID=A0A7S0WGP3_9CHLO|mmetsp:Transcript_13426/g.32814  ORF Transcript_13426/g.32814 Transcript_13426/m.32814 type:complete len:396 (+) Transcript_13426:171-1358(+)|eukprot:CAMPEP_0202865670 /NCGR_PEP_ID=MMETSP1391-20130828/6288_1 /ASSEMBLY_ACC=CAM_ASM_000867 /TAXON_ID=1034604 /ORGANISM="Chlamydomonas leiostraca, Strain SAG 11-49" /LENGTH=395 /DNA_ID=CAMNT_0049545535 /DNA_START=171 /DNA_END=1358 /DNA_ORIENTATION=-
MSRCPFGFTGAEEAGSEPEDIDVGPCAAEEADTEGDGTADAPSNAATEGTGTAGKKKKKSKKTGKAQAGGKRFDFDTDPVSWFYQNQIRSEEEFQAKKEMLRAEARKRLDAIMDKKNQRLLWPSDSEFDDLSMSSGELSELDSDVHSLASLRSCAASWIEDQAYKLPAESTLRWAAFTGMALSAWAMYLAYNGMSLTRKVAGVILRSEWPAYAFTVCLVCAVAAALGLLAANWRSKRLLLTSQVLLLLAYAATVYVGLNMRQLPTEVDTKLRDAACARWGKGDTGSRLCHMLPAIQSELADTMVQLMWAMVGVCLGTLALAALGCWYTMELCFVEKKAAKHLRRHKRRKHSIPWEKIKIVGPVTNCGANGPPAGAAGGGGGCPVMHTGGPKDKNV